MYSRSAYVKLRMFVTSPFLSVRKGREKLRETLVTGVFSSPTTEMKSSLKAPSNENVERFFLKRARWNLTG